MEGMEGLENLFDSCDTTSLGKVPVSKLILTFTNEVNGYNNNDHPQHEKEEILMTVRSLLDPTGQDVKVDKATWLAAWRKQAESPSPKKRKGHTILDIAGGDDFGIGDTSGMECQVGPLDVSKHSYCFSPSSRSSSLEDSEEVVLLKDEIHQLQSNVKSLKQQLAQLEETLLQEQFEKQQLETIKDSEINRLTKQCKSLIDSREELKCSLDACEREKLDLCKSVEREQMTEQQLKLELTTQKRVVAALSLDIEDHNQEKNRLKLHLQELQTKLNQQAKEHQGQVMEFQKTIQNFQEEKDELNARVNSTMLERSKPSAFWDDLDCSSNLETELAPLDFQSKSFLTESPPSREKSLLVEMQAVPCHAEVQTQAIFDSILGTPPKKIDKCNQAEIQMCPVETQTSPYKVISIMNSNSNQIMLPLQSMTCQADKQAKGDFNSPVTLPPCHVETQTQADFNSPVKIPLCHVGTQIRGDFNSPVKIPPCHMKTMQTQTQTDFNSPDKISLCNVETQTQKDVSSPVEIPQCHVETQTQEDLDFSVQVCPMRDPKCNQVHSKELLSTHDAVLPHKPQFNYLWVALSCAIFFVLLIVSTIFCTGAVLEVASQSGVLSFPYLGQSPRLVRSIVTPFVKVTAHHLVKNDVPV